LENAVDFARERVEVAASWSGDDIAVTITDDGPGFAPEIMDRIGEPYVTSRRRQRGNVEGDAGGVEASGLGLGFFIAKTLLERSGATLDFENRAFPDRGAIVRVQWGRNDFERPMAFAL
jgi:two-component system sensor histidine kinase RegB